MDVAMNVFRAACFLRGFFLGSVLVRRILITTKHGQICSIYLLLILLVAN